MPQTDRCRFSLVLLEPELTSLKELLKKSKINMELQEIQNGQNSLEKKY